MVLLLGLCIVLAGCSGSTATNSTQATTTLPPDQSPAKSPSQLSTGVSPQSESTPTITSIPTSPSTPISTTSTPTSTPTDTQTTPTSTPTETERDGPQHVYAGIGEWTEVSIAGKTDLRVRVNDYTIQDEIQTDDGSLDAPEGEQWVVVNTTVRTLPGDDIQLGYTQWRLVTVGPQMPQPDDEAMRHADYRNLLPDETTHRRNDAENYRIIFATDYTESMTFVMQPFGSQEHPSIVFST